MDKAIREQMEDSLEEWSAINKQIHEREIKDRRIISEYCATNTKSDITKTIKILQSYEGMPSYDKDIVNRFESMYPDSLTIQIIEEFSDLQDIYADYLLSGGEDDDWKLYF